MFVTFFVMNVYLLMSGLFTPIDSMAPWVQRRLAAEPGAALRDDLARDPDEGRRARLTSRSRCSSLTIFGAVTLALAIRQYSKRVS